jgi:hypothetical protein
MQRSSQLIINTAAVVANLAASCAAHALTDRSAASGATHTATVTVYRTNKGHRLPETSPPIQSSSTLVPANPSRLNGYRLDASRPLVPLPRAGADIFLRCLS